MTSLCDLVCILKRLRRIWKKTFHFFGRFHIILTALIAHTVFICQFLTCLKTEQYIMRLCILCKCIMHIIGRNKFYSCLTMHFQKLLIDILLFRNAMILQFQKEIPLPENILITKSSLFCILVHASCDKSRHFTGKTRT